jgi:hypothetical protein
MLQGLKVGGVKMKKNEKKFEKTYFLYSFFGLVPWLCLSKIPL